MGNKRYERFVQRQAQKNGLNLVDVNPYLSTVEESRSIDEVMDVLNGFTANFGIATEIATERDLIDTFVPFQPVDKSNISLASIQNIAKNFIYNFKFVPAEVIKASGAKKVKLVNSDRYPDPNNHGKALRKHDGLFNDITRILYLDIEAMSTYGNTPLHELAHGIDEEYCAVLGGEKDTQFGSRNPQGFIYGQKAEIDSQAVINEYASRSSEEDKAETLASFLTIPQVYPHLERPIRDKIDLLLSRLELKIPGINKFYAAIAGKDF